VNPRPDPSNPQLINPVLIPVVKHDGVFGNQGVVSFFNYQPVDTSITPSIIPNQPVSFDASSSFLGFNGSSTGFRLYSWNFGDGSGVSNVTSRATNTHTFRAPGNYTVSLTVWDAINETGTVTRKVNVLPALGSLSLTVKDQIGTVLRGNVRVRVFNSSLSSIPFVTKTIDNAGGVQFSGLSPGGSYYLIFSGDAVENSSKTELVQPGLTTYDTVYMSVKPGPADYGGLIYVGTILGGLGLVTAAVVYKKRSDKSRSSRPQTRKERIKN
jgi:PKD repeat protein